MDRSQGRKPLVPKPPNLQAPEGRRDLRWVFHSVVVLKPLRSAALGSREEGF